MRLLRHLCDKRRTKFWDYISQNSGEFAELSEKRVCELDEIDKKKFEQRRFIRMFLHDWRATDEWMWWRWEQDYEPQVPAPPPFNVPLFAHYLLLCSTRRLCLRRFSTARRATHLRDLMTAMTHGVAALRTCITTSLETVVTSLIAAR